MTTFAVTNQASFDAAIASYGTGDVIHVLPGLYLTTRQIASDGGTLYLDRGATIRNTWDQCFLFDDDDSYGDMGVTSFRVAGQGRLESVGGIVLTHGGNDNWQIAARTIDGMGNQIGYIYSGSHLTLTADSIVNAGGNAAFEVNGTLDVSYTVAHSTAKNWLFTHPGAVVHETAEPITSIMLGVCLAVASLFRRR